MNNPDGAGYAFVLDGKVKIVKALKWSMIEKQYKKDYRRYGDRSPFLVHFRIASHGAVCYENCHPFALSDGGAMIHNGMLPFADDRTKSDTKELADNINKVFAPGWQHDTYAVSILHEAIGKGNKLVFLWPNYEYLIVNESSGFWRDKAWFSNYSCNIRQVATTWKKPDPPATTHATNLYEPKPRSAVQTRPYIDDGLYAPHKSWNSDTKRWDMPLPLVEGETMYLINAPTRDIDEAAITAGENRELALVKNYEDFTKHYEASTSDRHYADIQAVIRANDRFMKRMKGATLVPRGNRLHCSRCMSDLTDIRIRLDHDEEECAASVTLSRAPSTIITGTNGRHVVRYS